MSKIEPTEVALIEAPTGKTAVEVFTGEFDVTLAPLLKRIRAEIDRFRADVATKSGRDLIKSMAYRITRSKTALDGAGKVVVDDLKALPKKIDENRKRVRDTLDAWAEEVRKPLDEFEKVEAARVLKHSENVKAIYATAENIGNLTVERIKHRLYVIGEFFIDAKDQQEFAPEYQLARDAAIKALAVAQVAREKYDADQVELASLRAAQADRDAKEADKREAAAREAREKAQAEAREQAERDRALREAAEKDAFREREARRQAEDEARTLREADQTRQRREAEDTARKAAEDRATEMREKDKAHRKRINNTISIEMARIILQAYLAKPDADVQVIAQAIIVAIAKGDIPNVRIEY